LDGGSFARGKAAGREAYQSPASRAEVKSCTCPLPSAFTETLFTLKRTDELRRTEAEIEGFLAVPILCYGDVIPAYSSYLLVLNFKFTALDMQL
jgi:hypothetical protein